MFADFRVENIEAEGPSMYTQQRRVMRKERRVNRRKADGTRNQDCMLSGGNPKLITDYHGSDAEYLKVQALQLLLRHQVAAIRKLWSLPDIYEVGTVVLVRSRN